MRIGWKLALALVVPLVGLMAAMGYVFMERSRELLREELTREGRGITRVVQLASEDYLRDRQVTELRDLADKINGYERVLGVRLFDEHGTLTYQTSSLDSFPFQNHDKLQRVLNEKKEVEFARVIGKQPATGFLVPLQNGRGQVIGAVQVLQLESYIDEDAHVTRDFILTLTLAMVVAIVLIVLIVTRFSISRPIASLVRSFREMGAREMPTPVPVTGNDEFALLSREFNNMRDRLEAARTRLESEQEQRRDVEERLRNSERLAGLGRLAAGLAHEIGTPLNVISGRARSLQRTADEDPNASRTLAIIVSQTDRIVRIVRDMLDFARQKPPRRVPTDLGDVLQRVLDLVGRQLEARGIRIESGLRPNALPKVSADPDQLQQVFLNLVINAMDAMPEGGTLNVQATTSDLPNPDLAGPPAPTIALTFADTGTGIALADQQHVFDPFFTTKEPGKGTGLGLSVSYGIIEEHGGWFDLETHEGQGTSITVFLPVAATPTGAAPTTKDKAKATA